MLKTQNFSTNHLRIASKPCITLKWFYQRKSGPNSVSAESGFEQIVLSGSGGPPSKCQSKTGLCLSVVIIVELR